MGIEWVFFEADAESHVSTRRLPHIDMSGHLTFVTFRLADSMPHAVVQCWHDELNTWMAENGLTGMSVEEVLEAINIKPAIKAELRGFKNLRWHNHLDDCHGACILREPEVRTIVADCLLHFEGQRYDIERFVIMPNHVHLLLQMRYALSLRKQLSELLRYSGRAINRHLGRQGACWQAEPFDHVVRSLSQFERIQRYISSNPDKARLAHHEYTLWTRS